MKKLSKIEGINLLLSIVASILTIIVIAKSCENCSKKETSKNVEKPDSDELAFEDLILKTWSLDSLSTGRENFQKAVRDLFNKSSKAERSVKTNLLRTLLCSLEQKNLRNNIWKKCCDDLRVFIQMLDK